MLSTEVLNRLLKTQLESSSLSEGELLSFRLFIDLLTSDHYERRKIELSKYSIYFNLLDKNKYPYIFEHLSIIYEHLIREDKVIFMVDIAPPGEGKTTEITQGSAIVDKALGDNSNNLMELILTELETVAREGFNLNITLPRPKRKVKIFHVSFDKARSDALKVRSIKPGGDNEIFWILVNNNLVAQVEKILAIECEELKEVRVEIPGIFDEDRGKSLLHYLVQKRFPVYGNALFSDPEISEKSLAMREYALKTKVGLLQGIRDHFNTELTGFGTSQEDDRKILKIFEDMCPPQLINHIKRKNYEGAKKMRKNEQYREFIKRQKLTSFVDFLGNSLPVLTMIPESGQNELKLVILTSYWYMTEMLKIPPERVNIIYNRLAEGKIEYDIRR